MAARFITVDHGKIERLTYDSVAVGCLCADPQPDHDSICKFRSENKTLRESSFHQVLECAARGRHRATGGQSRSRRQHAPQDGLSVPSERIAKIKDALTGIEESAAARHRPTRFWQEKHGLRSLRERWRVIGVCWHGRRRAGNRIDSARRSSSTVVADGTAIVGGSTTAGEWFEVVDIVHLQTVKLHLEANWNKDP